MLKVEECISFRADLAQKRSNNNLARAQASSNDNYLSPRVNGTLGWTHGDIFKQKFRSRSDKSAAPCLSLIAPLFQSPLHVGKLSHRGWRMELAIDSHLLDQNKTYEMHFAVWITKTWILWPLTKNGYSAGKFQSLLSVSDTIYWLFSNFPRELFLNVK